MHICRHDIGLVALGSAKKMSEAGIKHDKGDERACARWSALASAVDRTVLIQVRACLLHSVSDVEACVHVFICFFLYL